MEKSKSHSITFPPPRTWPVLSLRSRLLPAMPLLHPPSQLSRSVESQMHLTVSIVSVRNSSPCLTSCAWWTPILQSSCSLRVSRAFAAFPGPPQAELSTPSLPLATSAPWLVLTALNPKGRWAQVCLSHGPISSLRRGSPCHVANLQAHETPTRCLVNAG